MNKLFFPLFGLLLAIGCQQTNRKTKVLTSDGAFNAEIKDIQRQVKAINKDASLSVYFMNKEEIKNFSTEIPYWQEVRLNQDKNGLRQCLLTGGRSSTGNKESLYFDKKNKLIYATKTTPEDGMEQYYFVLEKLMQARDGQDSLVNIEKNQVKITAINLVNEAKQLRKFVAKKNLNH